MHVAWFEVSVHFCHVLFYFLHYYKSFGKGCGARPTNPLWSISILMGSKKLLFYIIEFHHFIFLFGYSCLNRPVPEFTREIDSLPDFWLKQNRDLEVRLCMRSMVCPGGWEVCNVSKQTSSKYFVNVWIFWEGHKIWKNLQCKIWRYWVVSNFKWKIFSNFKFCGLLRTSKF